MATQGNLTQLAVYLVSPPDYFCRSGY